MEHSRGGVHGIHQNKFLPGTGHGNVEDALLFRQVLPPQRFLHSYAGQGRILDLSGKVDTLRAKTHLRMDQNSSIKVLPGEAVVQVRQDHDGKLQSLGLVDAHQPHTGNSGRRLGQGSLSVFNETAKLGHKGKETAVAAAFKLFGMAGKGDEILPPLGTLFHGPENTKEVQAVIKVPEKTVNAHIPSRQTQFLQHGKKGGAVFPAICRQSIIKAAIGVSTSDLGQAVR